MGRATVGPGLPLGDALVGARPDQRRGARAALETRLRARATESEGEIEERLDVAERQLELEPSFRHRIVNDDLERALAELEEIVRGELDAAASMSGRDSSSR